MKTNLLKTALHTAIAGVMLGGVTVCAQVGGGAPGGMSAALFKLFGTNQAFSAKVEIQVMDSSQQELANVPMGFLALDKKIRMEMDLMKMRNKQMPPGMADSLKQLGMAQLVNIMRPDKKLMYTMYPDLKAVFSQPLPDRETDPKIETTELGKETVDGHPCVKNKNVLTDSQGKKTEATTWNDLKGFPLQIQATEDDNTSIFRFKQVQLDKPDEKLFEPPADYTAYAGQAEFRDAMTKKMSQGAPQK